MHRILNADCKFCGARRTYECRSDEDLAAASREWLQAHRPCAKGREARIDVTGQTEKNAPEFPVLTAIVRGGH